MQEDGAVLADLACEKVSVLKSNEYTYRINSFGGVEGMKNMT